MRALAAIAFAITLTFVTSTSHAQDENQIAEARALFERGSELARQRRFSEAADSFSRSAELVERASTLFNLGLCQHALGMHLEALEVLERFLALADATEHAAMITEANDMTRHARGQIGVLEIVLLPPTAVVTLNGELLEGEGGAREARVNPGTHVVRAEATHHAPELIEVRVGAGRRVRRAISLANTFRPSELVIEASGGEVQIDGESVGEDRVEREVEPGPHRVAVTRDSYPPFETNVDVGEGERIRLHLDSMVRDQVVEERRAWKHPVLWAAIGFVLAGAAATGLALGLRDTTQIRLRAAGPSVAIDTGDVATR